ncbi:MAG: YfiT family bacillithiol transferase [Planctomycetota bacterium]
MNAPQNPAGPFEGVDKFDESIKAKLIDEIREAPARLAEAVSGLTDEQLDTKYRNWTVRQIVHHVADSHVNSYMRFKWTLAEETPTIKAYEEADWVALADSASGAVDPPLALLSGLHEKWVQVLESMTESQYARAFIHPQSGDSVTLWEALNYYPWHGKHHTGQILWLREQNGW